MSDVRTQIAIDNYLEDVKQLIITFYNQLGLRASGMFINDLRVTDSELIMVGYGRFIGDGTGSKGKGGAYPVKAILEWMRHKGIQPRDGNTDEQTAWLIARKVSELGTDIFQGADGIPYDMIIDRVLEKDSDELADAIFFDVLESAGFEKQSV